MRWFQFRSRASCLAAACALGAGLPSVHAQAKESTMPVPDSQPLLSALIPATHALRESRRVMVDGEAVQLSRHVRTDGRNTALEGEHFSTVVAADGTLRGFADMALDWTAGQPLPTRERAEAVARAFLRQHAPDLLARMEIHWIAPHDETLRIPHKLTLTGMKVKMRNRADGRWFWVIVGGDDERVVVFERDIVWIRFPGHRQTEKWLHDAFLKKHPAPKP